MRSTGYGNLLRPGSREAVVILTKLDRDRVYSLDGNTGTKIEVE